MKSVSPEKYNKNYYSIFKQPNYRRYNPSLAAKKFREIDALVNITSKDLIVDFGCGQGDMCFFLSAKYHCKVIGIDYSKDAIDLALSHLKDFKYAQKQVDITFYNLDNDHLPDLSGVKYVFLNDVVEHLYDPELSQVFKKMYSWGDKVTLVVHTDNTIYLNYVRPFTDIIGKYFGGYDRNYFASREVLEKLHINLTNPRRLRNFLLPIGFRQTQLEYPQVAASAITGQLGLKPGTWLSHPIKFILNIFKPLSPSFYAAYKKS